MEAVRSPFQGVLNIIRFNWHFYLLSTLLVLMVYFSGCLLNNSYFILIDIVCCLIVITTLVSLVVSFFVYDLSDLYQLNWLNEISIIPNSKIVNIHAGFDEISALIQHRFPSAQLLVYDFFDPLKHTEVSIKRARKAYPPFVNTQKVITSGLPMEDDCANNVFVMFSAHEIRNEAERNEFFLEIKRILKPDGRIVVIEHLRDISNFLAYNIGFFHFFSKRCWIDTYKNAGLIIGKEFKITPFITTFILEKNGT